MEDCVGFCLEFLPIKDVCELQGCSKAFQNATKKEIGRRANLWKEKVSLGWACGETSATGIKVSADDLPFEEAAEYLDDDFVNTYAKDREELLENISSWCGGWAQFLHARENHCPELTQQPAWNTEEDGEQQKPNFFAGSTGKGSVVMVDIHCDGAWQWSAVIPTRQNTYGAFRSRPVGGGDFGYWDGSIILPVCSAKKGLGDPTNASTFAVGLDPQVGRGDDEDGDIPATIDPLQEQRESQLYPLQQKPPSYLLSVDSDDRRQRLVSVSLVSPYGSETFLVGFLFAASSDLGFYFERQLIRDHEGNPSEKLLSISLTDTLTDTLTVLRSYQGLEGDPILRNGSLLTWINGAYFWDPQTSRFHILMDFVFNGTLLQDILMRPPPSGSRSLQCPCGGECGAQPGYCSRRTTQDWPEGTQHNASGMHYDGDADTGMWLLDGDY